MGEGEPVDEEDPALLERRADECAQAGDFAAALALRERAFAGWRVRGDLRRAAHLAAYTIAFDHLALFGSRAVAQGWLERGAHLVREAGECAEAGWVALSRALHTADPALRVASISEAARVADRFGDADLGFDALAHHGLALVEDGRVTEGMRRLDEAATAAQGGEVSDPVVACEIFCKLLVACESTLDVRRAQEWQRVTAPLGARPALAWASAICRTHYGGILVTAGRWEEADAELSESLRLYDATYPALRSAALVRLAELRTRQGRLAESSELLAGEPVDGYAVRPWARSQWLCARDGDERTVVATRLARAVGPPRSRLLEVPVLALLTEMQVSCGDLAGAARTAAAMTELTATDPVDALVGHARASNGCVLAAAGASGSDVELAVRELEGAIAAFSAARLPLEAAGARLRLAEVVAAGDPALARAEARTAVESFARIGAKPELDRASALLRALGAHGRAGARRVGPLTDREAEVLALVAQGLSNPQIARRLYISRKTAAHHVSSVLAKLGVQNRAEAAAWAAVHPGAGPRGGDGERSASHRRTSARPSPPGPDRDGSAGAAGGGRA